MLPGVLTSKHFIFSETKTNVTSPWGDPGREEHCDFAILGGTKKVGLEGTDIHWYGFHDVLLLYLEKTQGSIDFGAYIHCSFPS